MNRAEMNSPNDVGVWVALRMCGCVVGVVVDRHDETHAKDVRKSKREFLAEGLSVIYATWDAWLTQYRPQFMEDCPHERTR